MIGFQVEHYEEPDGTEETLEPGNDYNELVNRHANLSGHVHVPRYQTPITEDPRPHRLSPDRVALIKAHIASAILAARVEYNEGIKHIHSTQQSKPILNTVRKNFGLFD